MAGEKRKRSECEAAKAETDPKQESDIHGSCKKRVKKGRGGEKGAGGRPVGDIEDLMKDHESRIHGLTEADAHLLASTLISWFDANQREMPWRKRHEDEERNGTPTRPTAGKDATESPPPVDDVTMLSEAVKAEEREEEVGGGEAHRRRMSQRAYEVWVSETMLQQTRVTTVVSYYTRWMQKFPTVASLAAASEEEIMEQWTGLGYYRRAKMLHKAAVMIQQDFAGLLPDTAEGLLALPGVGNYTAGAVSSIAYGQRSALVDGNVARVLARIRAVGKTLKAAPGSEAVFWQLARQLMDGAWEKHATDSRPGCLNQALMELGATICLGGAATPLCQQCPVGAARGADGSSLCRAYAQVETKAAVAAAAQMQIGGDGKQKERQTVEKLWTTLPPMGSCSLCASDSETVDFLFGRFQGRELIEELLPPIESPSVYPVKKKKAAPRKETAVVCIVTKDEGEQRQFLICQRPDTGLLASMWEFPSLTLPHCDDLPEVDAQREAMVSFLLEKFSLALEPSSMSPVGSAVHLFSHIRQTLLVLTAPLSPSASAPSIGKWVTEEELKAAAVSTGMKKCFGLFLKPKKAAKKAARKTGKRASTTEKASGQQPSIAAFFTKK